MSHDPARAASMHHAPRIAVAFPSRNDAPPHETASLRTLARKLAGLLKLEFVEDYRPESQPPAGGVYYVPSRTLVREGTGTDQDKQRFIEAIQGDDDLFGGIVPYDFVATKAISHSLLHPDSQAPEGWSLGFSRDTVSAVLQGTTVFSMQDARLAGLRLLALGPIRIKPVRASGGRGQTLVDTPRALDVILAQQDEREISRYGLVLEEHLQDVETLSVGQARAAGLTTSYVGTQLLTADNENQLVYGGSSLLCVRGDYDKLLALPLTDIQREAVRLARLYDSAAQRCYPGLFASRRNYDVAIGKDARGRVKMGVLEQSWRAGGASFAEACALEALQASPDLFILRAYTCEAYGLDHHAPRNAQIIYQDEDPEIGFVTKYGGIDSYGHLK